MALAITAALSCAFILPITSPAKAATSSITVNPKADAHVAADSPGTNYGSATSLEAAGSPTKRAYMRFDVSIPQDAVVTRTTLRVFSPSASGSGYDVHRAPNNAWSEGAITFANAPSFGGVIARAESVAAGWNSLVLYPVDPGTVTYVLTRTGSNVPFQSRETETKPQLIVEYTLPVPVTTVPARPPTTSVAADARVQESTPDSSFGASHLSTDGGSGPDVDSYLRFTVGAFLGPITSVKLRLRATTATADGPAVFATSSAWSESTITWNNRPPPTSGPVDDKGAIVANSWVEYDVTPLVAGNGTYSFILATTSTDDVNFASREGTFKPQLVVNTTAGRLESRPWLTTMSWEATVADFNIDGLDDFLVTRHESNKDALSIRRPAVFIQGFSFPPGDRHGCAAGDVNGDSRPDLYCMEGGERGEGQKQNELWIAQPDGTTYVDEAALWGVTDPFGRGRRPVFLHFNNDGLLDLYITNFGPRADGERSENILYLNAGGSFVENTVTATGSHGSACAEVGDWNNDNRQDLVVCGERLNLFRNAAGTQTQLSNDLLGAQQQVDFPRDAKLKDLNGDGKQDLVLVTMEELQIRLNLGSGARFSKVHRRLPLVDGRSVAVGDVTADGLPDVYVVQGYASGRNWDDVLLAGPTWLPVEIPQTDVGHGGTADIINVGGRVTVLVTNGFELNRGPVQLISFRQS